MERTFNSTGIGEVRHSRVFTKATAVFVIAAFLQLNLQPTAVASQLSDDTGLASSQRSNEEKLARHLQKIEFTLGRLERRLAVKRDAKSDEAELKVLAKELDALNQQAISDFNQTERFIRDKKLSTKVLNRHIEAVKRYETEMATLKANLNAVNGAGTDEERDIRTKRSRDQFKFKHKDEVRVPLDPNALPTRILEPNKQNKPKLNSGAFIGAGLFDNPYARLASHGAYRVDRLPGASDPLYLAATPEVVLSDAIRAKAEELGHKPVRIYQWVKNNIEWVPSWGSTQGAELTLLNLKGNSIDTASLLIALLRASDIPARYVHGTIEVPSQRLMNWAGGFSDAASVWDFVSSGGVPVSGSISGGRVASFRMEHVWVEAAIDFQPSRGAINRSADSWLPLDASFKQLDITPGFDVTTDVPFNVSDYLSQVRPESPVAYYYDSVQKFLDARQLDQTIGQAMGFALIQQDVSTVLPSSLPNRVLVVGARYGALPAGLRNTVQLEFVKPRALEPETFALSTADIAGKRLTLSYLPASAADEATIASYGGDMYAVPPYLLYLTPTLKSDGVVVYQAEPIQMGEAHSLVIRYNGPTIRAQSIAHKLICGGYYAVGLNLQGVNHNLLGSKNARLIKTLTALTPATAATDALIGEHLTAMMLTWYMSNDKQYQGAAKLFRVAQQRGLSAGLAGFTLTVRYLFGLPRSASINKAQFDVGLEAIQAASLDGNAAKRSAYLELTGLTGSYNEHGVWEAMRGFESVSAVKGLQAANAQGIPVHTLTAANFDQIFPLLQLANEDEQEIQQGVQAGFVAIVPEREVTINQWTGAGFIIKDPQTHSGIYRISGGLAGGSTTSQSAAEFIRKLFGDSFGILRAISESITQSFVVGIAKMEMMAADETCEVPYESTLAQAISYAKTGVDIAAEAEKLLNKKYADVEGCSGLVIRAHAGAGISLDDLARKNGTGDPRYVPNLFALAGKVGLGGGIREGSSAVLPGDIVFFNYTYERSWSMDGWKWNEKGGNVNCVLADNAQPTHAGIVKGVKPSGVIEFFHASKLVAIGYMNLAEPSKIDKTSNTALRALPVKHNDGTYCPSDARRPGEAGGVDEHAGALFAGYSTVRNVK